MSERVCIMLGVNICELFNLLIFNLGLLMLIAARRIGFRVANPKIMHDKNALKNDSRLSFVKLLTTLVPHRRHQINQNGHHDVEQTR